MLVSSYNLSDTIDPDLPVMNINLSQKRKFVDTLNMQTVKTSRIHTIGQLICNELGLYYMCGNVDEQIGILGVFPNRT